MKRLLSTAFVTFSRAIGDVKLGQPVPDSNFASDLKRSLPHATH